MRKKKTVHSESAVYKAVVKDIKPKRKRRTKAEMQALRAAAAQVVTRPGEIVKPKRKRRTKAEMEAWRASQAKGNAIETTVKQVKVEKEDLPKRTTFREAVVSAQSAPSNNKKQIVFKFGAFVVKAVDRNNLSLELSESGSSVFLGYYQPTATSLIKLLEDIGARLLIFPKLGSPAKSLMSQKQQMEALSNVNTILDAFHKFKTFLRSEFISENKDNLNNGLL